LTLYRSIALKENPEVIFPLGPLDVFDHPIDRDYVFAAWKNAFQINLFSEIVLDRVGILARLNDTAAAGFCHIDNATDVFYFVLNDSGRDLTIDSLLLPQIMPLNDTGIFDKKEGNRF
jgi:hypothetical protein